VKIIAIDFETANPRPGNACQIGLAWIEDGRITRVEERLIRPRDGYFTFTWCHGITEEDVADAPEFPDVLAEFYDAFDGALMLAHNAGFDEGVFNGCVRTYDLTPPRMNFLCTLSIARRVWPDLPSKSLKNVAGHLGITFRHHNAAEDARACAEIALAAKERLGCLCVSEIASHIQAPRRRAV